MSDFSGLNIISTETEDNKVEALIDNLDKTLKDKSFLTKDKFNIVKNSIINRIDTISINRHSNVECFIKPEQWSIEKQIHNIMFDNVIETYEKYFNIDNFIKSVDKYDF